MIDAVKALHNHIMTEVGATLRYLWTDSDPVTLPTAFTENLAPKGIKFGVSPQYQHEKNEEIERIHKPLPRLVTVLLHAGKIPIQLWPKAHAVAIGILKPTPTNINKRGTSPLHAWTGHKPDISTMRMFGNPVSALNLNIQRTDEELRLYPFIYMGPSSICREGHQILARYSKSS
jgi:hypothetical protein